MFSHAKVRTPKYDTDCSLSHDLARNNSQNLSVHDWIKSWFFDNSHWPPHFPNIILVSATISWFIWKSRCSKMFQDRNRITCWRPPSSQALKFNIDASFVSPKVFACIGILIRDNAGSFKAANCIQLRATSSEDAEGLAILVLLNGSKSLISKGCKTILKDCKTIIPTFDFVEFTYTPRDFNRPADSLAKAARLSSTGSAIFEAPPSFIFDVLSNDKNDMAVAGIPKPKAGAAAEGNNRRALGDIGNLVTVRGVVDGKPQQFNRPITRSFCAQLLANAQTAGAENTKKQVAVIVDAAVAGKRRVTKPAQKKVTVKPEPEMIIEISPDTEEVKKEKPKIQKSSRKKVQTLTSVLSARSKFACGLAAKPKDPIVDIDGADVDNQLAAVEYVEDLYKFYKLAESSSQVHDYMDSQKQINENMRMILVDWLIEVHHKFELEPETLYLTIHIVDRYLSMHEIQRRELQLLGISSMLIASKYEEIWAPEVNDFVTISDRTYTREHILGMEKSILGMLGWTLTVPTPYVFLVRFIKAAVADKEMENMAFFLAELGLMQYAMIMYSPSMLAASAVYAARCTLNKSPLWNETLEIHTGFSESQLIDCAKLLVSFHSMAAEHKLRVVFRKYSSSERSVVALLPPAKNLLV
ncbi:Cyclin [Macleaya cordata]|uniref:Cyclin n=1 Tax=Macleaya cordata TaxID=56857 RepID=A0A200R7W3_MACCD|nr:Cyclin [Macleaya cordata]